MKIHWPKITTKDIALLALAVSAGLASYIFSRGLVGVLGIFLLIGMFFGLLSKDVRWYYWGTNVLVTAISGLDRLFSRTATISTASEMSFLITEMIESANQSMPNNTFDIINNTLVTNSSNAVVKLVTRAVDAVFIKELIIGKIAFGIVAILTLLYFIYCLVMTCLVFIVCAPMFIYTSLMLVWFHDVSISQISLAISDGTLMDILPIALPYISQGIYIQSVLGYALLPLVMYKMLKRFGFYRRIPKL